MVPSLRTRSGLSPDSVNEEPAAYTVATHSALYTVTAPVARVTRTTPGWWCQPDEPPTSIATVAMTKSTGPLVWNFTSPVLYWTSFDRVPRASTAGWKLLAGVASAVPAKTAIRASASSGLRIDVKMLLRFMTCLPLEHSVGLR